MPVLRHLLILFSFVCCVVVYPQAGKGVFQILDIELDSRTVALGGMNVSNYESDLNLSFNNPALLSDSSHNSFTLNYVNYLADINFGSVGYSRSINPKNHLAFGIKYLDLGKFKEYDHKENYLGDFTAKDIVLSVVYSRKLNKYFSIGTTAKPIFSYYQRYSSYGLAFDMGTLYHNEDVLLDIGLVVKNIGFQFNGYHSAEGRQHYERLPLNIIFGISKKLKKAPLRFSLTLHNLQQFNLGHERSSTASKEFNQTEPPKWYNMMLRHTIWAVEIIPTKNLYLSVAFNTRRKAEMNLPAFRSIAGFSFGAGVKIKAFRAGFSLAQFQTGALTYHFTITTDLKDFGLR